MRILRSISTGVGGWWIPSHPPKPVIIRITELQIIRSQATAHTHAQTDAIVIARQKHRNNHFKLFFLKIHIAVLEPCDPPGQNHETFC